ncbi:PilZ domain-containing protein, partial [Thermoflexus sp.]|uniref:PilZ domain-containing protein n=1 Tax=Thermoflexus sp. TaxID=1969742 RepID=UPI0026060951
MNGKEGDRTPVLTVNIDAVGALYVSYMPWVQNGGLFVPTPRTFDLGTKLILRVVLSEEPQGLMVKGTVVWINPKSVSGGRVPGVGVQFGSDEVGKRLRALVESKLG